MSTQWPRASGAEEKEENENVSLSAGAPPPTSGRFTPSTSSAWLLLHYFICVNGCFINKFFASSACVRPCICARALFLLAGVSCLLCLLHSPVVAGTRY